MRIPVITINDRVSLQFVEAETRTEALLKAATAWIEQCGGATTQNGSQPRTRRAVMVP